MIRRKATDTQTLRVLPLSYPSGHVCRGHISCLHRYADWGVTMNLGGERTAPSPKPWRNKGAQSPGWRSRALWEMRLCSENGGSMPQQGRSAAAGSHVQRAQLPPSPRPSTPAVSLLLVSREELKSCSPLCFGH